MIDRLRTASARLVVRFLPWPPSLLLAAWRWLAAETDDLTEKQRCIEVILKLDPDSEWAHTAWLYVLQEQRRRRMPPRREA